MFHTIKKSLLLFALLFNVVACSYSPSALKEMYRELPDEVSSELKEAVDLNATQNAMIDDYAQALGVWHREYKLPVYSQDFARLANLIRQGDIPVASLKRELDNVDDMPHFEEATHLTSKVALVGRSLSDTQISQLENYMKNARLAEFYENKNEAVDDVVASVDKLFSFIGISLSSKQKAQLRADALTLHDLNAEELEAGKQHDQQLIAVLRRANTPEYFGQFARVWNQKEGLLTGRALKLENENKLVYANMVRNLILGFSPEQREQFSSKLSSISRTLSEMANE